jgi:hypothetical protein
MGKGKKWSSEECKHLAMAWISVSEDTGEVDVKGTDRDSSDFWKAVTTKFASYGPEKQNGIYGDRAATAVENQWKDQISRDVKKFNKSLLKVMQYPGLTLRDSIPDGTRATARRLIHECL